MIATFFALVGGALALDPAAFRTIEGLDGGLLLAVAVLVLAGAAGTLGQCVVLILNRVTRRRFYLALAVGGLEFLGSSLLWIFAVWAVVGLMAGEAPPFSRVVRVVGLAQAPLLFGLFGLAPLIGPTLGRGLRVWAMLAGVVGIQVVFGLPPWAAAIASAAGFLLDRLVVWLTGGLSERIERWLWRAKTGRTTVLGMDDVFRTIREQTSSEGKLD